MQNTGNTKNKNNLKINSLSKTKKCTHFNCNWLLSDDKFLYSSNIGDIFIASSGSIILVDNNGFVYLDKDNSPELFAILALKGILK